MIIFKLLKCLILGILALVVLLALYWLLSSIYYKVNPPTGQVYGVTFSPIATKDLGLDSDKVYQSLFDDLKIKDLRLPVYWNEVEKTPGHFDFSSYDQMLDLAQQKGTKVTLVLGYKVPRWPECFAPKWNEKLSNEKLQEQILELLKIEVNHFKGRPEITAWQVENEPLLTFGICKMLGDDFLKQEVDLVRTLDSRPIILTDSGERGFWISPTKFSDIFGTTLYRTVWDQVFGMLHYPYPPFYYPLRAFLTTHIFAPNSQGILISELQAEPWPPNKPLNKTPIAEQIKLFSMDDFQETVGYAAQTNIKKQYFWGVEWWYFMKTQGHPEYWDFAKTKF